MSSLGRLFGKVDSSAPAWERLTELEEYHELCRVRLEHVVPVREPLVLVTQIQRSGGTLLSQLFDGHPECHAHPHELKIGYPRKRNWPVLDPARPESWFEILFEKRSFRQFVRGYSKTPKRVGSGDVFPFIFSTRLQKAIFDASVASRSPVNERDVLDCYFTSYFNAWLDNQNLYAGPKRVLTAFVPRLAMEPGNVDRFFGAYPDGWLVSIVRDPRVWYAAASSYAPEHYGDLESALRLWRCSTEAALDARERFGERVLLLTYEQLVQDTEATVLRVAELIGITFTEQLLVPTFNQRPIRANSGESVDRYGVLPERASARRDSLDAGTTAKIDELAGELYHRAAGAALA